MEEAAQRIRGLACNLCPGEPLGKKGVLQTVFLRLQQLGIIQIKVNVVSLDSTCIKVHPAPRSWPAVPVLLGGMEMRTLPAEKISAYLAAAEENMACSPCSIWSRPQVFGRVSW